MKNIEFSQRRVAYWVKQGYEVLQLDECVFQSDHDNRVAYAPIGQPIHYAPMTFKQAKHATVCAAISVEKGLRFALVLNGAYNTHEFMKFIQKLLLRTEGDRVALFLDNASWHNSGDAYDFLMHHYHRSNVRL